MIGPISRFDVDVRRQIGMPATRPGDASCGGVLPRGPEVRSPGAPGAPGAGVASLLVREQTAAGSLQELQDGFGIWAETC